MVIQACHRYFKSGLLLNSATPLGWHAHCSPANASPSSNSAIRPACPSDCWCLAQPLCSRPQSAHFACPFLCRVLLAACNLASCSLPLGQCGRLPKSRTKLRSSGLPCLQPDKLLAAFQPLLDALLLHQSATPSSPPSLLTSCTLTSVDAVQPTQAQVLFAIKAALAVCTELTLAVPSCNPVSVNLIAVCVLRSPAKQATSI